RQVSQHCRTAGTEIEIVAAIASLVGGREILGNGQIGCQLEETVAVVVVGWTSVRRIEAAVAGDHIEVAEGIDGWGRAAHPDAALLYVRRHIQDRRLRERLPVIGV